MERRKVEGEEEERKRKQKGQDISGLSP